MNNASQFLKTFFGSLILISQPPHSPSSADFLPSTMASPAEFSTTDSPALPPRNDAPIAEVRKGTWRDHTAVLIPDPGYFVAGGLAGVASRKLFNLLPRPLTMIQATRCVLLNKHIWAVVVVGQGLATAPSHVTRILFDSLVNLIQAHRLLLSIVSKCILSPRRTPSKRPLLRRSLVTCSGLPSTLGNRCQQP
jgi:hypothetical protein